MSHVDLQGRAFQAEGTASANSGRMGTLCLQTSQEGNVTEGISRTDERRGGEAGLVGPSRSL